MGSNKQGSDYMTHSSEPGGCSHGEYEQDAYATLKQQPRKPSISNPRKSEGQ